MSDDSEESHPALLLLGRLLNDGKIGAEDHDHLKAKFVALHKAFAQSCDMENTLYKRARGLDKDLKEQKRTVESSAIEQEEHRKSLGEIRQAVTALQHVIDETREQVEGVLSNSVMKQKELNKLEEKLVHERQIASSKMGPSVKQAEADISAIESEIVQHKETIKKLKEAEADYQKQIKEADEVLKQHYEQKQKEQQRLADAAVKPQLVRQQVSNVTSVHNVMLSEEEITRTQISELVLALNDVEKCITEIHSEVAKNDEATTKELETTEKIYVDIVTVRDALVDTSFRKKSNNEEMRKIKELTRLALVENRSMEIKLDRVNKTRADAAATVERLKTAIAHLKSESSIIATELKKAEEELEESKQILIEEQKALEEAQNKKELSMKAAVAASATTKNLVEKVKDASVNESKRLVLYKRYLAKEMEMNKAENDIVFVRDRTARRAAVQKKAILDERKKAEERTLVIQEQQTRLDMLQEKREDFAKLFDTVRSDYTRYRKVLQFSQQMTVELQEKTRIIDAETAVLTDEYEKLDKAVRQQKAELNDAFKRRDAVKADLIKAKKYYHELEEKIDFQAAETNRLNSALTNIEDRIMSIAHRFKIGSFECAEKHRELLDKQDLLSILYEQFNVHEEVMKRGEMSLQRQDDEIKSLQAQIADFERIIDIALKKVPEIRKVEAENEELRFQIEDARKECLRLETKLEDTASSQRKRNYIGKDLSCEELDEKIKFYQERLADKEREIWESQHILEELEQRSQSELSTRSVGGIDTAEIKVKHRHIRRQKMSTIAELSLYKAQELDIQDQTAQVKEAIQESARRVARHEDFDSEATRTLKIHERDVHSARRKHRSDSDEEEPQIGRVHFDAYPTADGLSRPYGQFPVFQPSKPSGQMRHFKSPHSKAVVV